jgi:uncharacterized protein YciI
MVSREEEAVAARVECRCVERRAASDARAAFQYYGLSAIMGHLIFAQCHVKPASLPLLEVRREAHLAYIRESLERLEYGGIVQAPDGPYEQICYFIKTASVAEAAALVEADPYFCLYSKVEYLPFQRKIPGAAHED